jgi:hypothetical protein
MDWKDVGDWLKGNAGTGAALVGSLLTGNIPGAVAAGVSLVTSATGQATPDAALSQLQGDPASVLKLRELALQNEASIREHVRAMTELQLQDAQKEQEQTQLTIRSGDNAEDVVVRRTRPLQSWTSLIGALVYVGYCTAQSKAVDSYVLGCLLTLPWAYAGLRQIGKGVDAVTNMLQAKAGAK